MINNNNKEIEREESLHRDFNVEFGPPPNLHDLQQLPPSMEDFTTFILPQQIASKEDFNTPLTHNCLS